MAICRPVSTGTNTAEMLEGTSRGVDTDTLLFLFRPFPGCRYCFTHVSPNSLLFCCR